MSVKWCSRCRKCKPLTEYGLRADNGLPRSACRKCEAKRHREHRYAYGGRMRYQTEGRGKNVHDKQTDAAQAAFAGWVTR